MEQFIKYVNALEPIVKSRRDSLHSATKLFLKEQRVALFSLWEVDLFKIIGAGHGSRGGNGQFSRKYTAEDEEHDERPRKKGRTTRRPVFEQ